MNAKEAKLTATKRADEIEQKRIAAERKEAEDHAKKWRDQRANWLKNEIASIESRIVEAADKGQTKIHCWMATSDRREDAAEKNFLARFSYEPELKKVMTHFKKLGYTLAFRVEDYENVDLSDLNPRDNWTTYRTMLDVSW